MDEEDDLNPDALAPSQTDRHPPVSQHDLCFISHTPCRPRPREASIPPRLSSASAAWTSQSAGRCLRILATFGRAAACNNRKSHLMQEATLHTSMRTAQPKKLTPLLTAHNSPIVDAEDDNKAQEAIANRAHRFAPPAPASSNKRSKCHPRPAPSPRLLLPSVLNRNCGAHRGGRSNIPTPCRRLARWSATSLRSLIICRTKIPPASSSGIPLLRNASLRAKMSTKLRNAGARNLTRPFNQLTTSSLSQHKSTRAPSPPLCP